VCLEEIDEELGIVTTACCKKLYHETCFEKCVQINNKCPTCRTVIMYTEVKIEVVRLNCCISQFIPIIFAFILVLVFAGVVIVGITLK